MTGLLRQLGCGLAAASLLAGCAHLPEAKIHYYLATSTVTLKDIRTVACDAGGNVIVADAVTPTVTHRADAAHPQAPIKLKNFKGDFADADLKFDFYEDGRLSGVNGSVTGQGDAILKTAITVATTAAKFAILGVAAGETPCDKIKKFAGDKPLTLTYAVDINLAAPKDAAQLFVADAGSLYYVNEIAILGPISAAIKAKTPGREPVEATANQSDFVLLPAQEPGQARIVVTTTSKDGVSKLWEGSLTVAADGYSTPYGLPLPRPAWFGKKVTAASFAESGALKSVEFSSTSGANGALGVAQAALTAAQGQSTADKAAEVKAQADLIAQQQRLVACMADKPGCK